MNKFLVSLVPSQFLLFTCMLQTSIITGCNLFFQWLFFRIFENIIFCFVVAMCDLMHAVEAMYGLP